MIMIWLPKLQKYDSAFKNKIQKKCHKVLSFHITPNKGTGHIHVLQFFLLLRYISQNYARIQSNNYHVLVNINHGENSPYIKKEITFTLLQIFVDLLFQNKQTDPRPFCLSILRVWLVCEQFGLLVFPSGELCVFGLNCQCFQNEHTSKNRRIVFIVLRKGSVLWMCC